MMNYRVQRSVYGLLTLGLLALFSVWLMQTGNAQEQQIARDVPLPGESTTVLQSISDGAQSAIVSCVDRNSQPPVSSSAALVIPAPMNPSIAHEAVAINRLGNIMFTLSVTNVSAGSDAGVRLTLVNRLSVSLTCDVHYVQ
jgi:hypothetical protein